jgi:hypothetical protein
MILATTFSYQGYLTYGKKWIESVSRFWPEDTKVHLYIDFDIIVPKNFKIIRFNFERPQEKLKNIFDAKFSDKTFHKFNEIKSKVIKFSYKSFVICNELDMHKNTNDIFVWLDGDVETIKLISTKDIASTLNGKFLSCQSEKHSRKAQHTESGILIFDLGHDNTEIFKKEFYECYTSRKLFSVKKPYDGYLISYVLKNNNLDYFDFNASRYISGKTSNKDLTFQHVFLKDRFIHNIGKQKS